MCEQREKRCCCCAPCGGEEAGRRGREGGAVRSGAALPGGRGPDGTHRQIRSKDCQQLKAPVPDTEGQNELQGSVTPRDRTCCSRTREAASGSDTEHDPVLLHRLTRSPSSSSRVIKYIKETREVLTGRTGSMRLFKTSKTKCASVNCSFILLFLN